MARESKTAENEVVDRERGQSRDEVREGMGAERRGPGRESKRKHSNEQDTKMKDRNTHVNNRAHEHQGLSAANRV